ncbi:hypothetical protein O181_105306 [Austropuccinia psidii MF-1]|uniref:Uncharacterized protein n=1 Tax=Austropuccinia psidii MF-1 TaxID=1389203 RepID=A0A9Q3JNU5_9BASI|nr:hypothetical protein [Austropuccinia psidii MF-1]
MQGGGPKSKMMARGPRTPRKTKGPPRRKIKDKGLAVGKMEIGQGGNDGRIWPEALNDDGVWEWSKGNRALDGANFP